jgi:hypothetical protein
LMFQTPTPQKRGERKNKPRRVTDSSRAERVKLTQFLFNQRKTRKDQSNPKATPNKPRSNLASIFGTLLSSQESDAHQHNTFQCHAGATV